jgi:hypothetical protein
MTRWDRWLLTALVGLILMSIPLTAQGTGEEADTAFVTGPAGRSRVPLDADGRYVIEGRCGRVVLVVANGELRCADSSCPDGWCVESGVLRPGHPIVCAPNGVSVVLGGSGEVLDAITR